MKSRSKNTWFRCPSLKALQFVAVILNREIELDYAALLRQGFPVVVVGAAAYEELLRDPARFIRELVPGWLEDDTRWLARWVMPSQSKCFTTSL